MEERVNTTTGSNSELNEPLGTGYDDEERYLHQMLNLLREQHDKAAKPYYDRLAAIHAMKPVSMVVTADQARAMGFTLST